MEQVRQVEGKKEEAKKLSQKMRHEMMIQEREIMARERKKEIEKKLKTSQQQFAKEFKFTKSKAQNKLMKKYANKIAQR